jgi:hypothetical protein
MNEKLEVLPSPKSKFFQAARFFAFYMDSTSLCLANRGLARFGVFFTSSIVAAASTAVLPPVRPPATALSLHYIPPASWTSVLSPASTDASRE